MITLLTYLSFDHRQIDIGEAQPIIEIPIDPFLDTVMCTWIRVQSEMCKELDATFKRHDENGDGVLSLSEFTGTWDHCTQAACFCCAGRQ